MGISKERVQPNLTGTTTRGRTTTQAIESLGFQVISHPRYIFFFFVLFLKLKEHLNGTTFAADEKVKAEVKRCLGLLPEINNFIWTVLRNLLSVGRNALLIKTEVMSENNTTRIKIIKFTYTCVFITLIYVH